MSVLPTVDGGWHRPSLEKKQDFLNDPTVCNILKKVTWNALFIRYHSFLGIRTKAYFDWVMIFTQLCRKIYFKRSISCLLNLVTGQPPAQDFIKFRCQIFHLMMFYRVDKMFHSIVVVSSHLIFSSCSEFS